MQRFYTDDEIGELIREPKGRPPTWRLRPKRGFREAMARVRGTSGNVFEIRIRQSHQDEADFSILLAYVREGATGLLHLRRYNGSTHEHRNPLEKERFRAVCHVHTATERYQRLGGEVEHFARPTSEYTTLDGAWRVCLRECGFDLAGAPAALPFEELEP